MTLEVSLGRESSQGNVPLFKHNFKDADAGSMHLYSSLTLTSQTEVIWATLSSGTIQACFLWQTEHFEYRL